MKTEFFELLTIISNQFCILFRAHEQNTQKKDDCQSKIMSLEQHDLRIQQEIKNKKALLKKTNKNLEKEKEKLVDLEATPEKSKREIKDCEMKLNILEASVIHICMCNYICAFMQ